jgi:glyoxylase-like metal-dependent hydrolase (beta-lactamase superfamily II)
VATTPEEDLPDDDLPDDDLPDKDATPLGRLVNAGESQTEATEIADGIYLSADISNSYLITTDGGSVLVNTGMNGARHKALFDAVSDAPIDVVFLTQSHGDHYGGLAELRGPTTRVVTHEQFPVTLGWAPPLAGYFGPRTAKLWGSVVSAMRRSTPGAPAPPRPTVVPDVLVGDHAEFEVGGRRFETIATPDGETVDSICVWMPDERIVFTGNTFGPIFLSMPFLVTLRGDRPRFVDNYLRTVDRVRDLGAEMLVTGHGDPIVGADTVRAGLTKMRDAVAYVRDETTAGMSAGKDVHTLMREIELPPELQIGEFHGRTAWNVRSIWEGYAGWFYASSTTELYGVPSTAVDDDLLELAGIDRVAQRAAAKEDAGAHLEAIHLAELVLRSDPDHHVALGASLAAHRALLEASGSQNLSETMWLKSEIASLEQRLDPSTEPSTDPPIDPEAAP